MVALAFDSERERDTFQTLITKYAKKDSENERSLLRESWWQPFCRSSERLPGYQQLTEHTETAMVLLPMKVWQAFCVNQRGSIRAFIATCWAILNKFSY